MKNVVTGILLVLYVAASADAQQRSEIIDFMTMDVCLDEAGNVLPGVTPLDTRCRKRRDIRSGDRVPYHLARSYLVSPPCGTRLLVRNNVLQTYNGVDRVVAAVLLRSDRCSDIPLIPAYYAVRWADDQFGFTMGWWARGAGAGRVTGGITPVCENNLHSSRRHFRNWVFAADGLSSGATGYGVFTKQSYFDALPPLGSLCPTSYRARYLAIWARGEFKYASGALLDTILSHPYSQADESGTTPGRGHQMERTYLTRELGQVRWEAWKREGYRHRDGRPAKEMAKELADAHGCNRPFEVVGRVTPGMEIGPLELQDGVYSQIVRDVRAGTEHRWYMANCQDMTALIPPTNPEGDPFPNFQSVPPQFWDFWTE